jgi:ACS family hexuronate transporter-like MFS transporter
MNKLLIPERRRWLIVGIILFAIAFNYVDRQLLSILRPLLEKEFDITNQGYALIVNLFTICYALMYPVGGWLVDKYGAKFVMFFGLITWSLASIGGGFSRTVGQFGFFRALLGIGEPVNFPAQLRVVTIWFTGKLRATANSLSVAGSSIGSIIAPPLVAWLAISYGWHSAFIFTGIVGLLIAIIWIIFYRDPPEHIAKQAAASSGMSRTKSFSWGKLWRTRSLWGILLIRFISDPVWYFILFWLPGYLQEHSGLTLAQIGFFGWIPFLAADLGGIGTSAWSDWMVRRGRDPLRARKIMLSATVVVAPLCAFTPYLPTAWSTILVFCFVAAMCISWLFSISVVVSEVFPVDNVASVLGIAGGCGAAGAVLFNYFIGQFLGTLGAENIFLVMAFLHPAAVLILWTMVKPEKVD